MNIKPTQYRISKYKHSNGSTFSQLEVKPSDLPSFYIELPKEISTMEEIWDCQLLLSKIKMGLTPSHTTSLSISGVGFRAWKEGSSLYLNIGKATPTICKIPNGLQVEILQKNGVELDITGRWKDDVTLFASQIVGLKPAYKDKYKHKGISILSKKV